MKKNTVYVVFMLAMLVACRKELRENIQSAEDNAQIENEFSSLYDAVSDFVATDTRTAKTDDYILPSGAVVSFTDSLFSDGDGVDFTINFGPLGDNTPKGTLCRDGRYRAGIVRVMMDRRWKEPGCVLVISVPSANEYYVGNGSKMYKVTGTKTITRTSEKSYQVTVNDATLQRENGTVSWQSQRTVTLVKDAGPGWLNDEYEITGSASGTNVNGESFTVETISPLLKKLSIGCMSTFVAGELKITSGGKSLQLNYDTFGDKACDKTATVTYRGRSRDITLW
ncbi:MAG: hypothetical protein NZM35_06035 [Chitinophagales bacterium]|nr:hypothetical protein [Chitinophagales bacterium]MDW8417984.1 hypothetical protein [Chitinophagales bacterium]